MVTTLHLFLWWLRGHGKFSHQHKKLFTFNGNCTCKTGMGGSNFFKRHGSWSGLLRKRRLKKRNYTKYGIGTPHISEAFRRGMVQAFLHDRIHNNLFWQTHLLRNDFTSKQWIPMPSLILKWKTFWSEFENFHAHKEVSENTYVYQHIHFCFK